MEENKICGCEINGSKYVIIYEKYRWNFYKIIADSTMSTTPTTGLDFKDSTLCESEKIKMMGKKFLQLKSFLQIM